MESLVIEKEFWDGRRVFVTGHTGFKGSWLCLWLSSMGAHVTGYAKEPPTEPSMFQIAQIESQIDSHVLADVNDLDNLTREMAKAAPEIVIHMAAQSLVRESYTDPVNTYMTNVMGTVHVLEAARQAGSVAAVLVITSDKCYENREWVWGYRETDPMGGHDPYSSSKGAAELVASAYYRSFYQENHIPVATARAGNVIGGGDWAYDRIIPDAIRAFNSGKELIVRSPGAIRPWQHVLEPLSGYLVLCQRLLEDTDSYVSGWNFGPGEESNQTVSYLLDLVMQCWGEGAAWVTDQNTNPHEANFLKLDCSKARAKLGWDSRWDLKRSTTETVEWYKAWSRQEDMLEFSLNQVNRYMADGNES